ncbi:MAG: hypothetical protein HN348_26985, partial [Proteobacteria bacterium]|nr:hypothetical protein [Pseudomonadota bacterium]
MNRTTLAVLGLVGFHIVSALLFILDMRLPFALFLAVAAVVIAIEKPLWGVGLLIAGRLTSTGANAWVRLGKVNIDLFEPALLLCAGALVAHAVIHQKPILKEAPWRLPVLTFLGFQTCSLFWSTDPGEGVQEVLATSVLLVTTVVILAFVESWDDLRAILWVWLLTSLFVSLVSVVGLMETVETSEAAFEMAQGSREGGFGQHPNWFAMNLVYIVHSAFALAIIESQKRWKWFAALAGVAIFFAQMRSGSRGGTWSALLGGGFALFYYPRARKYAWRLGLAVAALVVAVVVLDVGSTGQAYERIFVAGAASMARSVRITNWIACWQMMLDSYGLGIGAGGYAE